MSLTGVEIGSAQETVVDPLQLVPVPERAVLEGQAVCVVQEAQTFESDACHLFSA